MIIMRDDLLRGVIIFIDIKMSHTTVNFVLEKTFEQFDSDQHGIDMVTLTNPEISTVSIEANLERKLPFEYLDYAMRQLAEDYGVVWLAQEGADANFH